MNVRRATPAEFDLALSLCHAAPRRSPAECATLGRAMAAYARALKLEVPPPWLLTDASDRPVAACVCMMSPGRIGLLTLSADAVSVTPPDARSLLEPAIAEQARLGTALLQLLLETPPAISPDALNAVGFNRLARLNYMERPLSAAPAVSTADPAVHWTAWPNHSPQEFARIVADTYEGSLDCPALSHIRSVDDALAAHRAAGIFQPQRWLLLHVRGEPAGCLLLNETPLRPALEVVYMGLRPAARGRGLGQCLIRQALSIARRDGFAGLCLAVDEANIPARRLYEQQGLRTVLAREAWLLVLPAAAKDSVAGAAR